MYKEQLNTIFGMLKSPNQSLQKICDNEDRYLVSSVIILIFASVFSINMASGPLDDALPSVSQFGIWFSDEPIYWITDGLLGLLGSIVLIAIIFVIGKKFGGVGNFKKIFAVVSHATLPVVIGGVMIFAIFFALIDFLHF